MRPRRDLDNRNPKISPYIFPGGEYESSIDLFYWKFPQNSKEYLDFVWREDSVKAVVFADSRNLSDFHTLKGSQVVALLFLGTNVRLLSIYQVGLVISLSCSLELFWDQEYLLRRMLYLG